MLVTLSFLPNQALGFSVSNGEGALCQGHNFLVKGILDILLLGNTVMLVSVCAKYFTGSGNSSKESCRAKNRGVVVCFLFATMPL